MYRNDSRPPTPKRFFSLRLRYHRACAKQRSVRFDSAIRKFSAIHSCWKLSLVKANIVIVDDNLMARRYIDIVLQREIPIFSVVTHRRSLCTTAPSCKLFMECPNLLQRQSANVLDWQSYPAHINLFKICRTSWIEEIEHGYLYFVRVHNSVRP